MGADREIRRGRPADRAAAGPGKNYRKGECFSRIFWNNHLFKNAKRIHCAEKIAKRCSQH